MRTTLSRGLVVVTVDLIARLDATLAVCLRPKLTADFGGLPLLGLVIVVVI